MSNVLCIYYSRTGHTRRAIKQIALALEAEIVSVTDGVDRKGWRGYLRSGMDAFRHSTRSLAPYETERPLGEYDLVIIGTPVWGGRCASPIRGFLKRRGYEMSRVAYVLTRGSDHRYEAVFDQMDLYTRKKRLFEVSLRPDSEGYAFWRDQFIHQAQVYLDKLAQDKNGQKEQS